MRRKFTRRRRPLADRFWEKVDQSGECWLWIATTTGSGYGEISRGGRRGMLMAHRVAWELSNGPIPPGMFVCHHCDVKICVRPSHLFLGFPADNTHDMHNKGRGAHGDTHPARVDPSYLPRGEKHVNARLTDDDVRVIRATYAAGGISQKALAERHHVTAMTVNFIVRGLSWTHI